VINRKYNNLNRNYSLIFNSSKLSINNCCPEFIDLFKNLDLKIIKYCIYKQKLLHNLILYFINYNSYLIIYYAIDIRLNFFVCIKHLQNFISFLIERLLSTSFLFDFSLD